MKYEVCDIEEKKRDSPWSPLRTEVLDVHERETYNMIQQCSSSGKKDNTTKLENNLPRNEPKVFQ